MFSECPDPEAQDPGHPGTDETSGGIHTQQSNIHVDETSGANHTQESDQHAAEMSKDNHTQKSGRNAGDDCHLKSNAYC